MKKHLLIVALQVASGFADFHYTNRNAHRVNFVETNPLARPFVTHGTAERAGYFAANVGAAIAGAELLEHWEHPKLSLVLRAAQIEENTRGAIFSATHTR